MNTDEQQDRSANEMGQGSADTSSLPLSAFQDDDSIEVEADIEPVPVSKVDREAQAATLARMLIIIFGISLFFAFTVIWGFMYILSDAPVALLVELNNVFDIVKIIGGIFTSLLAFILGYYFGLSSKNNAS